MPVLNIFFSGKTTTLKMLSGQLLPTYGQVSINGNSYSNLNQILQSIGFCPQYDSLIPKHSGRAHLELFAELRGKNSYYSRNITNNYMLFRPS